MGVLEHFLIQQIIDHFTLILSAISLVFIAIGINMPKLPDEPEWDGKWTWKVWYRWLYNTIQTALPINRFMEPRLRITKDNGEEETTSLSDAMKKYSKLK